MYKISKFKLDGGYTEKYIEDEKEEEILKEIKALKYLESISIQYIDENEKYHIGEKV